MSESEGTKRAGWWRLEELAGGMRVFFGGRFDEKMDFAPLKSQLRGAVEFQLAEVERVNSTGVREWVNFVHDLAQVSELSFSCCSPAIVTQLNTIYNFRGPAKVRSLLAPYVCEACSFEEPREIDLSGQRAGVPPTLPSFPCPRCQAPMAFDDLPERYLSFLKE